MEEINHCLARIFEALRGYFLCIRGFAIFCFSDGLFDFFFGDGSVGVIALIPVSCAI